MSQSKILLILPVLLALVGGGAWMLLMQDGPADRPGVARKPEQQTRSSDTQHADKPAEPGETTSNRHQTQAAGQTEASTEATDTDSPAETGRSADSEASTDADPQAGQAGSEAESQAETPAEPPRRLTPAQREEQRRIEHGRPALQNRLRRTPTASSIAAGMQKTPEQEAWEKEWREQGLTPPPMVPTPVSGKVMSRQSREGLAEATIHLMTFFPLDGVAGGPLLPVITTLTADSGGEFKGEVPGSELAPADFPAAAVGVTWQGRRILAAQAVTHFDVGTDNGLGIFWAPDAPYELDCDATALSGSLSLVSTGELDPQRIHPQKQHEFVSSFPMFSVTPREADPAEGRPAPGFGLVRGNWPESVRPFVSIVRDGRLLQTRVPAPRAEGAEGVRPFETLVFDAEGLQPISGFVVNASRVTVPNAVVVTTGSDVSQSAVTDSAGWFQISVPDEKTSALRVYHDDYVEVLMPDVYPGDRNVRVELGQAKPRVLLEVVDRYSGTPIPTLGFRIIGQYPHGPNAGEPMPEAFTELTAQDGRYELRWDYPIRSMVLERIGYFPRTLQNPVAAQEAAGGRLEISLSPGREITVIPREYTEARDPSRWYTDPNDGPGIRTNWAQQWIEWDVDFGDEPEQGEEGGYFDLLLGCTNHGLVDNQYEFTIRVYVDGEFKGTLVIPGDNVNVRTGRIALGKLSGNRRVRLNWTNDVWIPEQLDANVRYASMQFVEQPGSS
jgi:hypothetical protein